MCATCRVAVCVKQCALGRSLLGSAGATTDRTHASFDPRPAGRDRYIPLHTVTYRYRHASLAHDLPDVDAAAPT